MMRAIIQIPCDTMAACGQCKCVSWQALELRSLKLADMLQQTYSVSLAREPQFAPLLQRIKEIYLGAQSSGGMQEMMSNMMQMLTSGGS